MAINSLWFKWKNLKLPWRNSFMVGSDLSGNSFWEFKDALNAGRFRRIVKPNPKTHYADLQISPQWHQWLRYVREAAPTVQEQQSEVLRQEQMKHLARLADERWAKKPSYLDVPQKQQRSPVTQTFDPAHQAASNVQADTGGVHSAVASEVEAGKAGKKERKQENPWEKAKASAPGQTWEPEAWTPPATKKR